MNASILLLLLENKNSRYEEKLLTVTFFICFIIHEIQLLPSPIDLYVDQNEVGRQDWSR